MLTIKIDGKTLNGVLYPSLCDMKIAVLHLIDGYTGTVEQNREAVLTQGEIECLLRGEAL